MSTDKKIWGQPIKSNSLSKIKSTRWQCTECGKIRNTMQPARVPKLCYHCENTEFEPEIIQRDIKAAKTLFPDKIIRVKVQDLKINPYQSEYYSTKQENLEEYSLLKESIQKNGIKVPLQITQDNVIIGGHTRHRIALELGMKDVPCTQALFDLTDDELHLHFLEDNWLRKGKKSTDKKKVYSDIMVLVKKKYPNWEYLIRENKSNIQEKLEDAGLSTKGAEHIARQERRKAKKTDNIKKSGVIDSDYLGIVKRINYALDIFLDTNDETREKAMPTIQNMIGKVTEKIKVGKK